MGQAPVQPVRPVVISRKQVNKKLLPAPIPLGPEDSDKNSLDGGGLGSPIPFRSLHSFELS